MLTVVVVHLLVIPDSLQALRMQQAKPSILHCLPEFAHIHVHWVVDAF